MLAVTRCHPRIPQRDLAPREAVTFSPDAHRSGHRELKMEVESRLTYAVKLAGRQLKYGTSFDLSAHRCPPSPGIWKMGRVLV